MEQLVEKIIKTDYENIEKIDIPYDERVGLIVYMSSIKYEFLLNIKSNTNKLLVVGSGALPNGSKHDRKRPLFHRWSWKFEQSTIHYNDPTLYLTNNILGGWGLGTMNNWYLKKISLILIKLFKKLSIKNENIMFNLFS